MRGKHGESRVYKRGFNVYGNTKTPVPRMKKLSMFMGMCALLLLNTNSHAIAYNDTITAIFGSGNPDTGWVSDTGNGVQVAIRAKNRTDGSTPNNGAGVYSFATGTAPASTRARWNWEFSANSDVLGTSGDSLLDYTWLLSVDTDPSAATSFTTFNPFAFYLDNELGNNSTANGAGVIDPFNLGLYNVGQNSQNITFAPWSLDPNANATYDFVFAAYDGTRQIASTEMQVVVGSGGTRVPDNGSTFGMMAMMGALIPICRRLRP